MAHRSVGGGTIRLAAALDGSLVEYMREEAEIVQRAGPRAVRESTELVKLKARANVVSALGRRAGYLLTARVYDNAPGDSAGLLYSRWKRRGAGGKPSDVLVAHTYGALIEPRRGKYLYIPLAKGRLGRRERRIFADGSAGKVDVIPIGRDRFLIVQRRRRGRGKPIGLLVPRVRLRPRLRLEPIYRDAEKDLRTRLVRYLNPAGNA